MTISWRRVTFDSNAWERIFAPGEEVYAQIRSAIATGQMEGFICEAGFRIEAIIKRDRPTYFSQPLMEVRTETRATGPIGHFELLTSMGPDDSKHPGLPPAQAEKLKYALDAGVKIIRGLSWMGLPRPPQLSDQKLFVIESPEEAHERLERQLWVAHRINQHGVGKSMFDSVDGWEVRNRTPAEEKQFIKACAEWADGELVAAHIGYRNDILCTDDYGRGAGKSVFDQDNRNWLESEFGVVILGLETLLQDILKSAPGTEDIG